MTWRMTKFGHQVLKIYTAAVICAEEGLPKATWNATVYTAFVMLAVTSERIYGTRSTQEHVSSVEKNHSRPGADWSQYQ